MSTPKSKPPAPNSAAEQIAAAAGEEALRPGMADMAASEHQILPGPLLLRRKGDLRTEEVLDKQANRGLRDTYAKKAHELAEDCIHFWIFLILANGLIAALLGKQVISDTVVIAVTTGVTVNVLAAFLGVVRGLFPLARCK